jgi:hypothetical protein
MKKMFLLTAYIVLLVMLSGCLTTLHPIFTEKDLVYKPELNGKWKTQNGSDTGWAEITPLVNEPSIELPGKASSIKNKGYLIRYKEEDGDVSGQYIAFLARIGTHLYFDYYPVPLEKDKKADEFYMQHFVKMHTPYRVDIRKNGNFELSQLEGGYLDKLIEEKKIRINHEINSDGDAIITASTAELQQYILKYGDDPEALRSEKTIFSKSINL